MARPADLLGAYERAGSWEEAEAALDALAESGEGADAGVGDLFDELASAAAEAAGGTLLLVPGPPAVQRVFELTGLTAQFAWGEP